MLSETASKFACIHTGGWRRMRMRHPPVDISRASCAGALRSTMCRYEPSPGPMAYLCLSRSQRPKPIQPRHAVIVGGSEVCSLEKRSQPLLYHATHERDLCHITLEPIFTHCSSDECELLVAERGWLDLHEGRDQFRAAIVRHCLLSDGPVVELPRANPTRRHCCTRALHICSMLHATCNMQHAPYINIQQSEKRASW